MTWTIQGKNVVVTGGTSGIGRATVVALARRGAAVTLTSRSASNAERVADEIGRETGGVVRGAGLDLSDLASVRDFAQDFADRIPTLDILINNAGAMAGKRRLTKDGLEFTVATNYLGPFLLTNLLKPALDEAAPSRVINVSSELYQKVKPGLDLANLQGEVSYSPSSAYAVSKLALMLFTSELRRRWGESGVTAVVLHPGVVRTNFGKDPEGSRLMLWMMTLLGPFLATPERGAQTSVLLATSSLEELATNWYWSAGKPATPQKCASDPGVAQALWSLSEQLVGLSPSGGNWE